MRMKLLCRRLLRIIVFLAATVVIAGACLLLTKPADTGVPPPLRFSVLRKGSDRDDSSENRSQ